MPGSRAMDQKLRAALIGGALFLESVEQDQADSQPHYSRSWSQGDPSQSNRILDKDAKRFLDSMALLLAWKRGSSFVTACSLDRPVDPRAQPANWSTPKHPGPDDTVPTTDATTGEGYQDQEPPNFTLRIARNGPFKDSQNQKLCDFAADMINPGERGLSDWEEKSSEILHRCKDKIKDCIVGKKTKKPRIGAFSSFVEKLEKSGLRPPHENQAYESLVSDLKKFAEKTNKVREDGKWDQVLEIARTAAAIRRNKTYMALLSKCPPKEVGMAKKFLGRLGAYGAALDTLRDVRWISASPKHRFTKVITISVLPYRHEKFLRPDPEELESLVAAVRPIDPNVYKGYNEFPKEIGLKEHCEILLVRFYIENSAMAPVLPYLGVSKLCCFLCFEFLKRLQKDCTPVEFCVRGGHGKVYGKWLPPDDIEAAQGLVLQSLVDVATEIRERAKRRLEGIRRKLPPRGDSPEWSSDESEGQEDLPDENSGSLEDSFDESEVLEDSPDENSGCLEDSSDKNSDSSGDSFDEYGSSLEDSFDEYSSSLADSSDGYSDDLEDPQ